MLQPPLIDRKVLQEVLESLGCLRDIFLSRNRLLFILDPLIEVVTLGVEVEQFQ